jgi:hypothetical protein
MKEVHLIAQLADMKEVDAKHSLMLAAVIELLIEKGLLSREELNDKMIELDRHPLFNPPLMHDPCPTEP